MKATQKEMSAHTTQELIDHVESMVAGYLKASKFGKKLRAAYKNDANVICHEIQRRQLKAIESGTTEPVFS
ncbi:hypothetical protein N9F71_00625 [bacterium]|nr:hypothetical protein [bacterium]